MPRYCPHRAFPERAYKPGQGPHPSTLPSPGWQREEWNGDASTLVSNAEYRWGLDLFNHHYYWEAHEVWEELWQQTARGTLVRAFLQGLIQCAGALLKASIGQHTGCSRLATKALAKLDRVLEASPHPYAGVALAPFITAFREFCAALCDLSAAPRLPLVSAGGPL